MLIAKTILVTAGPVLAGLAVFIVVLKIVAKFFQGRG